MTYVYFEFRAVGFDRPDSFDHGELRRNWREAERDLTEMCDKAEPPFDDGWIESRGVGGWKKFRPPGGQGDA